MPQTTVRFDYGFGVVGESRKHGARRAKPGLINSANAANNVIGRVFTQVATGGTVAAGGTGIFYGLLSGPKQYASYGSAAAGPLGATIALPNQTLAEFTEFDYSFIVSMSNANVKIGDLVAFSQADGSLESFAAGAAVPAGYTQILGAVVDDLPQVAANGLCTISLTGPLPGAPASA